VAIPTREELQESVKAVVQAAKIQAEEQARDNQVSQPEAKFEVWKATEMARLEAIEEGLKEAQKEALRAADVKVNGCEVLQRTAQDKLKRLQDKAEDDAKGAKLLLAQINSPDSQHEQVTFKIWKQLEDESKESLKAAEEASDANAATTVKCITVQADQKRILAQIKAQGKQSEKVRAMFLHQATLKQRLALREEEELAKAKKAAAVEAQHKAAVAAKKAHDDEVAAAKKKAEEAAAAKKAAEAAAAAHVKQEAEAAAAKKEEAAKEAEEAEEAEKEKKQADLKAQFEAATKEAEQVAAKNKAAKAQKAAELIVTRKKNLLAHQAVESQQQKVQEATAMLATTDTKRNAANTSLTYTRFQLATAQTEADKAKAGVQELKHTLNAVTDQMEGPTGLSQAEKKGLGTKLSQVAQNLTQAAQLAKDKFATVADLRHQVAHAKAKLKLEEQRRSAASEHLLDTKHQLQQAVLALTSLAVVDVSDLEDEALVAMPVKAIVAKAVQKHQGSASSTTLAPEQELMETVQGMEEEGSRAASSEALATSAPASAKETDERDPSNPNKDAADVNNQLVKDMKREIRKAKGQKKKVQKKIFSAKEIKASETTAKAATDASDAERGAAAVSGMASEPLNHGLHQAEGLVARIKAPEKPSMLARMKAKKSLPEKPSMAKVAGEAVAAIEAPAGLDAPPEEDLMELPSPPALEQDVTKPLSLGGVQQVRQHLGVDQDADQDARLEQAVPPGPAWAKGPPGMGGQPLGAAGITAEEMLASDAAGLQDLGRQSAAVKAGLQERSLEEQQQMVATREKAGRIEAGSEGDYAGAANDPDPPWAEVGDTEEKEVQVSPAEDARAAADLTQHVKQGKERIAKLKDERKALESKLVQNPVEDGQATPVLEDAQEDAQAATSALEDAQAASVAQAKAVLMQQVAEDVQAAGREEEEVAALVQQLQEEASTALLAESAPHGVGHTPAMVLIQYEPASPSSSTMLQAGGMVGLAAVAALKYELSRHQDAASKAQALAQERLAAAQGLERSTLKAGNKATDVMLAAAKAQYAAKLKEARASHAMLAVAAIKDPEKKMKARKLAQAMQSEARSYRKQASIEIAQAEQSTEISKVKVEAHNKAKQGAMLAARAAQREVQRAEAVHAELAQATMRSKEIMQDKATEEQVSAESKLQAEQHQLDVLVQHKLSAQKSTQAKLKAVSDNLGESFQKAKQVELNERRKLQERLDGIDTKLARRLALIDDSEVFDQLVTALKKSE